MKVSIYDHYGDLIGMTDLDTAIDIHEISNAETVKRYLETEGAAIGLAKTGYVRLETYSA